MKPCDQVLQIDWLVRWPHWRGCLHDHSRKVTAIILCAMTWLEGDMKIFFVNIFFYCSDTQFIIDIYVCWIFFCPDMSLWRIPWNCSVWLSDVKNHRWQISNKMSQFMQHFRVKYNEHKTLTYTLISLTPPSIAGIHFAPICEWLINIVRVLFIKA